jgi:hypothetical protein
VSRKEGQHSAAVSAYKEVSILSGHRGLEQGELTDEIFAITRTCRSLAGPLTVQPSVTIVVFAVSAQVEGTV